MHRLSIFCLLACYIMGGLGAVPFHGDEADHLHKARDYVVFFVLQDPARLRVEPPVAIDSDAHIRLLTGTTAAYFTGFLLWNSGAATLEAWPLPWYYPQPPAWNRANGRIPAPAVLLLGRFASACLMLLATALLWRIGAMLAGTRVAILAATFFALHPLMLINGRRVMQEAALLCGSLLLLYLALRYLRRPAWRPALGMGAALGLALASKATALLGLLGIALGLAWGLYGLPAEQRRGVPLQLGAALLLGLLGYLLLTPAIWGNPPARARLAAQLRAQVLAGQTRASPDAYSDPWRQAWGLLAQPFPPQLQSAESPAFSADVSHQVASRRYHRSPWRGMMLPAPLALPLALLGGLCLLQWARTRPNARLLLAWGLVIGLGTGLAVPLAWQRYYLLWTLALLLWGAIGLDRTIRQVLKNIYG